MQHTYICDFHKGRIQCARTKRRRKESEDDSNETDTDIPEVDLYQLQVNTLRRYKKHYKVVTRPGMNKAQLSDVSLSTFYLVFVTVLHFRFISLIIFSFNSQTIMKHFKTIPIKEKEILTYFIYMVKSNSNKLDSKNGLGGNDAT